MKHGVLMPAGYLLQLEDTTRFRRICLEVALPIVVLGVAIGFLHTVDLEPTPVPVPVAVVRLLPTPVRERIQPIKPPEPVTAPPVRQSAVAHAMHAHPQPMRTPGRAAAHDPGGAALAMLHAQLAAFGAASPDLITRPSTLHAAPFAGGGIGRAAGGLARTAAGWSGGIGGSGRGVGAAQAGVDLGTRQAERLAGGFSDAHGAAVRGAAGEGDSAMAGRSLAEVQWVFDREKAQMLSMFYTSAQRHPGLTGGKIVVSLSIAPDGSVLRCALISSSVQDAAFEAAILDRIRRLNFGAKQVPVFNYAAYPINFLIS